MLNRRRFLSVAAAGAGAAMLACARSGFAASYDLIIQGGRVIDPSVRLDAIRDVAISGGRITAVEASIAVGRKLTPSTRMQQDLVYLMPRYSHTLREVPRWARPGPAGRRDRLDRCWIAGSRSHRRHDCRRAHFASAGPRAH